MAVINTDISYSIHTEGNGTIEAEFVTSDISEINQLTRGQTATFEFHVPSQSEDLVVSGSYTVPSSTTEIYDDVTVESGATLTIDGTLIATNVDNDGTIDLNGTLTILPSDSWIGLLADLADFAGGFATITTQNSVVKFREQIPDDADVDSILVGIEPANNLQNQQIPGIWGLVESGTDTRPRPLSDTRYQLSVTVLAEYDEYNDHTAVKNDLGV